MRLASVIIIGLCLVQQAVASDEVTVAGHTMRLVTASDTCLIEHRSDQARGRQLMLDLRPPCYLLIWPGTPPKSGSSGVSDGQPVGRMGEPMAWRYPKANGVIALAVIGDPMPKDLRASRSYQLREGQGFRCASSIQGVLIQGGAVRVSRKREHVGVLCAEIGLEEKDFWILAQSR
jgi:hypothetical protein